MRGGKKKKHKNLLLKPLAFEIHMTVKITCLILTDTQIYYNAYWFTLFQSNSTIYAS